jgi:lipopolysaccharide biosynthesis glycosyltransferase
MIHVGIAFDQNYFNQFGALSCSIFKSKKIEDKIHFHIITPDLTKEQKQLLKQYVKNHDCLIYFYSIDFELTKQFITKGEWTSAVYYRLFFPILLKDKCEKLLYLDSDIIVVNSIKPFFKIDLQNYPVAAVYDNYVKTQPLLGIEKEGEYFNSGVLLMDVKKWNEQNISEKSFKFLEENPEKIRFVDQCALNAVLKNNWLKIESKYNLLYSYVPWELPKKEQNKFLEDKIVIHYTLQRPWNMLCRNPLRHLYHKHLSDFPLKTNNKKFTDFSYKKISSFIKIHIFEIYSSSKIFKKINSLRKL